MADAGDIWYRALSGIGQNIGGGIAAIGEDYQQRHKAYQQQAGIADALSKIGVTPDGQLAPVGTELIGQDGKAVKVKSLIDQSAYDNFMARNKANSAEAIGGLNALNRLYSQSLTHAMTPTYGVPVPGVGNVQLTGPQAATYSAATQKANRPARTASNPDLNFTHAVNAHNAQVKQVEDYFHQNYGVGPADVLNDKSLIGYVFDKNKNPVEAKQDQTPDAYSVQTGLTMSPSGKYINDPANKRWGWITKDQLEAIKPQAEAWQQLQQNPPRREDYRTPAPSFVPDARALQIRAAYKAGKISPEEAIKALQAQ